tara:strand:- start:523 stop:930 length:408 start_codon:yes stop_codon:yes gene_type:complete
MNNPRKITQFYVVPLEAIIGQNSENADMGNPQGYTYGTNALLVASNEYGDTWEMSAGSAMYSQDILPKAQALADRLNARLALGKLPVGFDAWVQGRAVYGSDAYVAYGQDDDLEWELQQEERGNRALSSDHYAGF